MEIAFKHMQESDIDGVTEVYIKTFASEPWNEVWEKSLAKERIMALFSGETHRGYIAFCGGKMAAILLGYDSVFLQGKEFWIEEFCVLPEYQRMGIGQSMLCWIKKELSEENFKSLVLITQKDFPSEKFYRKNGFESNENMILMYSDF